MSDEQQKQMLKELADKAIFEQVKDYAYDYLDNIRDRHVPPAQEAVEALSAFDEPLPETSQAAEVILDQLNRYGAPATTAIQGGRYYGFVNGSFIPAAMAARWLSDIWDQNAALNVISPIAAKLESVCEAWLKDLLGLPNNVVAGFVSGSSLAIFCGLAAARHRVFMNQGWDIGTKGFTGAPKTRIVASNKIHGTVTKGIALLGMGTDNIEWVETDEQGRILVDQIPELDNSTIVILQAGNVCSGCFEDFETICSLANKAGAWVHIDGAFGLWAGASASLRHLTKGMEKAQSFSLDGHKTLNTPYDNGIVLCSDEEALKMALHQSGSYIVQSKTRDGMYYTPEMSRRARGIELWATLKYLGRDGVDRLVTRMHKHSVSLANQLKTAGFQVLNDVVFNQIMIACESDQKTLACMQAFQHEGEIWAGGAEWNGQQVIRISVCSWVTNDEDIARTVDAIKRARDKSE